MNDTFTFKVHLPRDQRVWYAIHAFLKNEMSSYRLVETELSESPESPDIAVIRGTVPRHIHQGMQSYIELIALHMETRIRDIVLNYLPIMPPALAKTVWERLLGDDPV